MGLRVDAGLPRPGDLTGVSVRPEDTVLARRAADLLTAGPADSTAIVAYACNLPSPPLRVAERIASAIFAGRPEFVRDIAGRWQIARWEAPQPAPVADPGSALSFAVVDVETTGGQARGGDRITEIAVVVVRDGGIADMYETLVNPERSIPPVVTALTNITWAMVKDAPVFRDVAAQVVSALSGHVFAAHNLTFDWKFVCAELARAEGCVLQGRRLCTVRLARRILPQLSRRSLDNVARYYGIPIRNRHRAGGDAYATARCLIRLLSDAQSRGCATWEDLEALARRPRRRRRRRPLASPTPVDRDTTA
jgi:DNA polymerase III subunit epsilon